MSAQEQFKRLNESWNHSSEHSSWDYKIGSFVFRICFGPSLRKLTRALNHLKIEKTESQPDLTICLWDASVQTAKLPPLDWPFLMAIPYSGYKEESLYLHWFDSIEALSFVHLEKKRAYYIVRKGDKLPWWVEGSPLQAILHVWLQELGLQLTHSAAIGNEKEALLLIGKGGSGKTTTALSCLRGGFSFVGEDYSLLQEGKEARAWSIYHSAKWTRQTRALFPQYESKIANFPQARQEKALLFYEELFPGQMKPSLPIRKMVSLSIGTEELPRLQASDPFLGIRNLMMSTLKQLPFCKPETVQFFKRVGSSLDHYQLILGRNISSNVNLLKELLR